MKRYFSRKKLAARPLATAVCLGLLTALILVVSAPVAADSLGDKVDDARIKARSGEVEEALTALDELAEKHPDDVRIHYYRSKFLRDLDRRNDAADALEAAAASLEKYKAEGGKRADILALKGPIEKDGKVLLKFRIAARKLLATYRSKSLPLIKKLLDDNRPQEAFYALEELSAALGEEDDELQELHKSIEAALRKSKKGK